VVGGEAIFRLMGPKTIDIRIHLVETIKNVLNQGDPVQRTELARLIA
jgi:hypothetical protein